MLLKLGFWQLDRADEKRLLEAQLQERQSMLPLSWSALQSTSVDDLPYRRVTVSGQYDAEAIYLLDNQIFSGKVGFQVLQVFEVADSVERNSIEDFDRKRVLINRGWIEGYADRRIPDLTTPDDEATLVASIHIPESSVLLLETDDWKSEFPTVIQAVDMDKIAAQIGADLFPLELRIEPGEWSALTVDWPAINTSPQKHLGYAVQWFAMSLALTIACLFANVQKSR